MWLSAYTRRKLLCLLLVRTQITFSSGFMTFFVQVSLLLLVVVVVVLVCVIFFFPPKKQSYHHKGILD